MTTGFGITVDCRDPAALAFFWRGLLGYAEDPPPDGYRTWADYDRDNGVSATEANSGASIFDPDGVLPRLYFHRVIEPKRDKNRWHLDIAVSAQRPDLDTQTAIDEGVARAVALGATVLRTSPHADDLFTVLRDPEGNEFCLA